MIAPQSRLIYWVALLVLPFSLLAALEPSTLTLSKSVIGAFLLLVIADALLTRKRLDRIRAEFPDVIRLTKDREDARAKGLTLSPTPSPGPP